MHLLTYKEGKFYTLEFDRYTLSLSTNNIKKQTEGKSIIVNVVNVLSLPLLLLVGYFTANRTEHHQRLYYSIGLISLLYQVFLVLLRKQSLVFMKFSSFMGYPFKQLKPLKEVQT